MKELYALALLLRRGGETSMRAAACIASSPQEAKQIGHEIADLYWPGYEREGRRLDIAWMGVPITDEVRKVVER